MIKIIILFWVLSLIWIGFEMWRAPLMEETPNGLRTIRPGKKLSDLFKKKKSSNTSTFSDLEKYRRGRSKY
ncbi:MAG: hypothetical protein EB100_07935 [Crocinitomicaceae bacterium]|jgi:hypothetical protein|nr:hypothetical protein [Crocinitomicaceae bacterium]